MKYTMMAFCMFLLVFSIVIPSILVREASATPSLREGPFKMVAIGDSLMWGQGLGQFEKFPYLVKERLEGMLGGRVVEMTVLAHSGAEIGADQSVDTNDPRANLHGEVPRGQPTIRELLTMYTGDPQDVDLVLVDGCINDITDDFLFLPEGVTTLVEGGPVSITAKDNNMRLQFRQEISRFCHEDMKLLLQEVASKFNNRETRIVVTGYYQVISDRTNFQNGPQILRWLTSGLGELTGPAISPQQMTFNWQLFQMDANRALKRAVNEVNIELWNAGNQPSSISAADASSILAQPSDGQRPPGTGDPFQYVNPCLVEQTRPVPARIAFACPRFTADSAMYAPNSFIFQLDRNGNPTDPARDQRAIACAAAGSETSTFCTIASTGHANQNGALAYADAIMATFSDNFIRLHKWDRVRATLLDVTFTDHTHPSHTAQGTIWFGVNSEVPAIRPVQMTSGVPITFTQGPVSEAPTISSANIQATLQYRIIDPDFLLDIPEVDPENPRPPIRPPIRTYISNSHMITDSNFEGVHSASTRGTVNDLSGNSHEISFTITYRIESMNP